MLLLTLQDNAMKWFNYLPLYSISSLGELVKAFVNHYSSNKPIKKESHHLFFIVQGQKENVESFMKRFKVEKLKIQVAQIQ